MPTDPVNLWVQATGATHPFDQKYDIYYSVNGAPTRVNLCGYSFFGEVAGLPGNQTEGLDLWNEDEGSATPDLDGPRYAMRFDYYLDQLKDARINFLRTWLFNAFPTRLYPFNIANGKYSLQFVNDTYLRRLSQFISKARDRGIVVCITLTARQSLGGAGWGANPFNAANNNNGLIDSANGLSQFCDIEPPPQPDATYNPNWNPKQRLYWIQRNLINKIVSATQGYWNVMYEIMNEPNPSVTKVVPWHVTVGNWLKDLLWDSANNRRTRLVVINAHDDFIENEDPNLRLVDKMAPAQGVKLADIFAFHGSQWGGRPGTTDSLCTGITDLTPDQQVDDIVNGTQGSPGILTAMRRFAARPLALIFDADALYWAQNLPKNYVQEVLNVDGSFDYRWSPVHLHQVNAPGCVPNIHKIGLGQRLSMIASAKNSERITVFHGSGWAQLPSTAKDIGVGANGAVWIIGTNAVGGGFGISRWNGTSWESVDGGAVRIAVGPQGAPWVVNSAGNIFRRDGNAWTALPGTAKDIGVGADGTAWIIGTNAVDGGFGTYRWNGTAWEPVAGSGGVRIAVGLEGEPWIVNSSQQILRYNGSRWLLLPGAAQDIGVGADWKVWIIGTNAVGGGFGIYVWADEIGWQAIDGGAVGISVDQYGLPWVVNSGNSIFRRLP